MVLLTDKNENKDEMSSAEIAVIVFGLCSLGGIVLACLYAALF